MSEQPHYQTTASQPVPATDLATLELCFERAIKEIKIHFQPIVNARSYQLFGYEALMRCSDPVLNNPLSILEAAERLNRLQKLGRHLRGLVARDFSKVEDEHGLVFVNIHALDLLDPALTSPYSPLAKLAGRVVLEITERSSLATIPDSNHRIADLRDLGFRIAIDDLGAGEARMKDFDLCDADFVKLDISVVRDVDSHPIKQQFVGSIVRLCHEHAIRVIGEGVESAAEADMLAQLECDLLQGYYLARPGPPFPAVRAR